MFMINNIIYMCVIKIYIYSQLYVCNNQTNLQVTKYEIGIWKMLSSSYDTGV